MSSKLAGIGLVVENELGSVRRYRVLELDEPRGRPPTRAEQAATAKVATRPPPLSWEVLADYVTPRSKALGFAVAGQPRKVKGATAKAVARVDDA